MGELLPILVADLANDSGRAVLEEVASVGGEAWVPLAAAPIERSPHVLEVYTPSSDKPLRLLAEPLGPPGEQGYPLRLFPFDEDDPRGIVSSVPPSDREGRASAGPARFPSSHNITEQHSAELAGDPGPPSVDRDNLIGRELAGGKLEIVSLLGAGSIGAVYRARHRGLRMDVAVKVLHRSFQRDVEFCRRFYAEALAMSRLDHPNLVRVYDFGQEPDGLLYLSMAFLGGVTLRTVLERDRRLDEKRIVELMLQVCAGLSHAHARGLIHRDVKPDNVMVMVGYDDDGHPTELVKVCDFGFAVPPSVSGAIAQRLAGTPVYMSPEQCRGEELDARTDVYACGIMLHELCTGDVPFLAEDSRTIMQHQIHTSPPLVAATRPDVDPRLERIIARALAKSREDRHASMVELRAELKELLAPPAAAARGGAPPSAREPSPSSRASSRASTPDWLEQKSAGYERFLVEMGESADPAEAWLADVRGALKRLVQEREPRAFADRLAGLDRAARALSSRGDVKSLWAMSSTLHGIASEGTQAPGSRAELASRLLHVFEDPELLGTAAERLLGPEDDSRDAARTLIQRARVGGAYALYGARVKLGADPRVRVPFITTMQALGEHAWPVIRAALERLPPAAKTGEHARATELAEDLLLSVPPVRDEDAGHLVVSFASAPVPSLCRAAARAITRVWTDRARPLLLGLLAHADDGVLVATIIGLRDIGAVDVHAVRRMAPLLANESAHGPQVRAACISAMGATTADGRGDVMHVLGQLVRGHGAQDDATVLAAARALVSIAGEPAYDVVRERAARSGGALGQALAALVP